MGAISGMFESIQKWLMPVLEDEVGELTEKQKAFVAKSVFVYQNTKGKVVKKEKPDVPKDEKTACRPAVQHTEGEPGGFAEIL